MSAKLVAGMPRDLVLPAGYVVRFAALDPTTGANVAGVTITQAAIQVTSLTDKTDTLAAGDWLLVPGQA